MNLNLLMVCCLCRFWRNIWNMLMLSFISMVKRSLALDMLWRYCSFCTPAAFCPNSVIIGHYLQLFRLYIREFWQLIWMRFLCWNQPLLGLFHAESGAGVWRRAVDDSLRRSEVSRRRSTCSFCSFDKNMLAGSRIFHEKVIPAFFF